MYCRTNCGTIDGLDGVMVNVETDISDGLPVFEMVGLLASEVREAKERVRIAVRNSGYRLPPKRITINLSPADVRKSGTGFDLAIAISILSAVGIVHNLNFEETIFIGELGLDGAVKKINGVLPLIYEAERAGIRKALVPSANAREAAMVSGVEVYSVENLKETVEFLNGNVLKDSWNIDAASIVEGNYCNSSLDFSDVVGQDTLKRAVEIAVAGMHNILIIGPPGSGKTMLASRIPGIMPKLTFQESMEITKIYSVAGLLRENAGLMNARPFRAPHHTVTKTAMTGGGRNPSPGEISLASKGVLFLDELPEFNRETLDILRQPLESGYINVSRVNGNYRFNADFILVCAMNPCKCGYFPDRNRCRCLESDIRRYLGRVSRPLMDRIDICAEADSIDYKKLSTSERGESSMAIRSRIERARKIQEKRFEGTGILYNSSMSEGDIEKFCKLDDKSKKLLETAYDVYALTARGYHRILKVARTIADLDASENIKSVHVSEAICYRSADRKFWGNL